MRNSLIIMTAMALTACNTVPTRQQVLKPIDRPCEVVEVQKPEFAGDHTDLEAEPRMLVRALRVEIGQRIAYETELEAALTECKRQSKVIYLQGENP